MQRGKFMNNGKIKVKFSQGIELVCEMLKMNAIHARTGKTKNWLNFRIGKYTPISEQDVEIINKAIHTAGWEVSETCLSLHHPNPETSIAAGETVVEQIKSLQKTLAMDYIYERTLEKTKSWFNHRLTEPDRYRFKEEEILTINLALKEIGGKLMSIELTL